jgi:hypothetical protein
METGKHYIKQKQRKGKQEGMNKECNKRQEK